MLIIGIYNHIMMRIADEGRDSARDPDSVSGTGMLGRRAVWWWCILQWWTTEDTRGRQGEELRGQHDEG